MRALRGPGIQTQLLMGPIVNRRRVQGDMIDVDKGEALTELGLHHRERRKN